jgi:hypothetical protein
MAPPPAVSARAESHVFGRSSCRRKPRRHRCARTPTSIDQHGDARLVDLSALDVFGMPRRLISTHLVVALGLGRVMGSKANRWPEVARSASNGSKIRRRQTAGTAVGDGTQECDRPHPEPLVQEADGEEEEEAGTPKSQCGSVRVVCVVSTGLAHVGEGGRPTGSGQQGHMTRR